MTTLNKHNDMPETLNNLSKQIVDAAFHVHKEMGPGLLEKIYEDCFICELTDRNIAFEKQKPVKVGYKHHAIPTEYKIDLLIEGQIILELKSVERLLPVHEAQVMSYMKLAKAPLGFLLNFNEQLFKNGIKRVVLSDNIRLHGVSDS